MVLHDDDLARYARQLILSGVNEEHQEKLADSAVLVVGAGGLGAPLLLYLAAAGVGHITIIDGDQVEMTNLNRQVCFATDDLGKPKASTAAAFARRINPSIEITACDDWLDDKLADQIISSGLIVADATDRVETRLMINRFCHQNKATMVFGGASRMEGQLSSFRSGLDETSPCFTCIFPDISSASQLPRCSEVGILGPVTGVIGSLMAMEVIRQCLMPDQPFGSDLCGKLMLYEGKDHFMQTINVKKRPDCPICGG